MPVLPFLLLFRTESICVANDFSRAGKKIDTSKIGLEILLHTNLVLLPFFLMVLFFRMGTTSIKMMKNQRDHRALIIMNRRFSVVETVRVPCELYRLVPVSS